MAGRIPVRARDVRGGAYTPIRPRPSQGRPRSRPRTHIRAITFDFWNTLYAEPLDGSAEASRAERMAAIREALAACGLAPTDEELLAAWRSGFAAYLEAWQEGRHFGAVEQVGHMLGRFGAAPLDGIAERTARRIEESGADANLQLQPGAAEVIPALADAGVKLGLISDTGLTPGRILRGVPGAGRPAALLLVAHLLRRDRIPQARPAHVPPHPRAPGSPARGGRPRGRHAPHRHRGRTGGGHARHPLRGGSRHRRAAGGRLVSSTTTAICCALAGLKR